MQRRELGPEEIAAAVALYMGMNDVDMAMQFGNIKGRPAVVVTWDDQQPQAKAGPESQAQEPEGLAEDEMLRSVGIDPGQ